ncbi:MAG: amino acid adenylation domain-containing protein [Maricaulaceae bacterium]|jgi:amino acid adenylation domain-containing protein
MAYLLWHYLRDSAARDASKIAIQSDDVALTYGELDALSDRICAALAARGIGPGARVGLYLPKSWMGVAVMAGVSKAGAAYVPVDPNAPGERAAYVLADCDVSLLVTTARGAEKLAERLGDLASLKALVIADGEADARSGVETLGWEDFTKNADVEARPAAAVENDPAYLLYTSGSTGRPKGVIISHRNAMAFVDWAVEAIGVRADDRLSNHAPLHFDLSVFDIYAAFKAGACVVLVPEKTAPFPPALTKWIAAQEISVWYSVPSALTRLLLHGGLATAAFPKLRAVLYAGEPFPVKYLREVMAVMPGARFFNLYGPTETNVCTFFALPERLDPDLAAVPIGAACANTDAFAVKDDGAVAGPGEEGELYVRGPTVMLGYWNLPERSASAVTQNPKHDAYADPVYRTGDIVQVDADGGFVFVGRRDHMVKSRGYRIELGEIEHALYAVEGVAEAAAVAIADDEVGAKIYAAVSLNDGATIGQVEIAESCRQRLPRYMIPEAVRIEPELPKTSTGKVDRVALASLFANPIQE